MYQRPSKGTQKVITEAKMKEYGIEIPTTTPEELKKHLIISLIICGIVSTGCAFLIKKYAILVFLAGLVGITIYFVNKVNDLYKSSIRACKMMGVDKKAFLNKMPEKMQDALSKQWDLMEVPETEFNTTNKYKPQGVNQSKQNKKKKKKRR